MDGTNDGHWLGPTLTNQEYEKKYQFRRRLSVPNMERRIITLLS